MSENASHSIEQQLKHDDIESSVSAAPDGGYGWVIVAATFVVNCIADGIAFSCGILFVEFKDVFEDTHGRTAFVGSLLTGIPMFLGPFCGLLIESYDCRSVTVVGSLISAFGFILSIFAPSVDFLCFSLGIVSGLGFSLVYVPAIVIVSRYFDSRRALATGICSSGSGVGTFVFPLFLRYMIDNFALEGTLLLLAGVILNCCVCAALYRPVDTYWETVDYRRHTRRKHASAAPCELQPMTGFERPQTNQSSGGRFLIGGHSLMNIPYGRRWTAATDEGLAGSKTLPPIREVHSHSRFQLRNVDRHAVILHRPRITSQFCSCPELTLKNQSNELQIDDEKERRVKCPAVIRRFYARRYSYLRMLFNRMLWSDWRFILFFVSNIILYAWYDTPYLYLPDHLRHRKDISSEWVIAILGVVNTVGQIIIGLLADLPRVNTILLYLVCMILTGIANVLLPHLHTWAGIIFYISMFGCFVGANYALCSVILVNLFGLGNLTTAYGMILFGQGVSNSLFPPICGFLRDSTGSYTSSFYVSGISIAVSGLILIPVFVYRKPNVESTTFHNSNEVIA